MPIRLATAALLAVALTLVGVRPAVSAPRHAGTVPLALTAVAPQNQHKPAKPQPLHQMKQRVPVAPRTLTHATAGGRSAAVTDTSKVAMRALVIAVDANDFGLPTWKAALDKAGMAYDVFQAKGATLPALVRADQVGKYDAILLTSNALLYQGTGGGYVSALDTTSWNTLWSYEKSYQVRQVSLYTAPGYNPEDYCLRYSSEGSVGDTPITAAMTTTGAQMFDYLNATAQVPLEDSYIYQNTIQTGCNATPLLTIGTKVVGVISPSTDGRERAALSFTTNQYVPQADLLCYGLLRWATKGVFLGESRHWINADVDDWFNNSDHLYPDGHIESTPGWRQSAAGAQQEYNEIVALRTQYPALGSSFTINLPYNGGDANPSAPSNCDPNAGGPDPLTSMSRCLEGNIRWLDHTYDHQELDDATYAQVSSEISQNLALGNQIGLSTPTTVLKTPSYSGLGVYPNEGPNPPVDHGLAASNVNMLQAAKDAGVKFLHGNISYASQKPSCGGCGIVHPLEPSLMVVPDWPTNIAYDVTTPDEETYFYNSFYGPTGKFPYWPTNQTYDQIIGHESDQALQHIMDGSPYTHTFHIGNTNQYATGKSLMNDWLAATVAKYSALYNVPLLNPQWTDLGAYAADRTSHFAALAGGADAVWDRTTNQISYTPTTTGALFVTGVNAGTHTTYGHDDISRIGITAGTAVTLTAIPRPAP